MNILLIHQQFLERGDGGGARFNEMSQLWREQGHQLTVLAGMIHYNRRNKPERYRGRFTYVDDSVPNELVIRCHISESYNSSFLGRLWAYFSFVVSSLYAGLFKARKKYDVIVVSSPPLFVGITALILSMVKRVPFVFEVRDLWPESAISTGVLTNRYLIRAAYWFESVVYRRASLVNVLTPAFRDVLIKEKGVPPEKVSLIPNAADFSLAKRVAESFDREAFRHEHEMSGKKVLVYVGAHGVANHLVQIIDAAELLRDRTDMMFVLVGDGMQKPILQELVAERKLDNVRFVDLLPRHQVFEYVFAADVGAAVLKDTETFKTIYSNKTFDYMACKRPVLLAIDGISRDLIRDANCGVWVPPENAKQLASAFVELADLPDDARREMGESGYRFAERHFDRRVLAREYLEHLQKVAGVDS